MQALRELWQFDLIRFHWMLHHWKFLIGIWIIVAIITLRIHHGVMSKPTPKCDGQCHRD